MFSWYLPNAAFSLQRHVQKAKQVPELVAGGQRMLQWKVAKFNATRSSAVLRGLDFFMITQELRPPGLVIQGTGQTISPPPAS